MFESLDVRPGGHLSLHDTLGIDFVWLGGKGGGEKGGGEGLEVLIPKKLFIIHLRSLSICPND